MSKILIMDDEAGIRNIVLSLLKNSGHELFAVADGKQAVEIAVKEKPDLALLDMRVPDMDGLEVLGELKKINPDISCIMMSGFGDEDSIKKALSSGARAYIAKPFKITELSEAIKKALAGK